MEQLGVQPLQLLTQIINFAVLLFLLNKFLYKPVLTALEARRKKIDEGLKYSEKMKSEYEKNEKVREEIIKKAKDEAKKIIEAGKKAGKELEAEIIEKARREEKLILVKARDELALEKQEMERQLRIKTVQIAKKWIETVLPKILDTKNQMAIIDKKIEDIAKMDFKVKSN